MSRALSSTELASLHAQATDQVWLTLLTISGGDLAAPLRFVNDGAAVTSRSNSYTPLAFRVEEPASRNDENPNGRIILDDVDRSIIAAVRANTRPVTVTFERIRLAAPDTVVRSWALQCRAATYDESTVSLPVQGERVLDARFPDIVYSPSLFPGLFIR